MDVRRKNIFLWGTSWFYDEFPLNANLICIFGELLPFVLKSAHYVRITLFKRYQNGFLSGDDTFTLVGNLKVKALFQRGRDKEEATVLKERKNQQRRRKTRLSTGEIGKPPWLIAAGETVGGFDGKGMAIDCDGQWLLAVQLAGICIFWN